MLHFFRTFFKTRIGMILALIFLGLIALAFAGADLAGTGSFTSDFGGDRVAIVDKEKIHSTDLSRTANETLNRIREQQPAITMPEFLEQGGLEQTLAQMIDRTAIAVFARNHGLRAGNRLVDSEIASFPVFRGADGKFDENLFRQMLRQQGLTEKFLRADLAQGLLARQVLTPSLVGTTVPDTLARHYAALLKESRKGAIAVLPSTAFTPKGKVDEKKIDDFYKANRADFTRPERRIIRYALLAESTLDPKLIQPSEDEIAARYKRDSAQYSAFESRSFTQLVASSETAAKAILAKVQSGTSLQAAAAQSGLAVTTIAETRQADFAKATSQAVATSGFSVAQGTVSSPAKGPLGWYLLHVDKITRQPARTLDQARSEIVQELSQEKHRAAFTELASNIEDQIATGASLAEVAAEHKLKVETTKPLLADGQVYMSRGESAPASLAPVIANAFAMEEGEPQIAEVDPGKTIAVYEIADIAASAPAPLAEIRADVTAAYLESEGAKSAKAAADRIMAKLAKGTSLAEAVRAEKANLPPPDQISMRRDELADFGNRVPPVLALLFSMAEGTKKTLEGPDKAGWFVVQLDTITPGTIADGDPLLANTGAELARLTGDEQQTQLLNAIRAELRIERNDTALNALRRQLAGDN